MPALPTIIRLSATAAVGAISLAGGAFAFTVEKNVNSGEPPRTIMVAFDKAAKDARDIKPFDKQGKATFSFAADGALEVKVATVAAYEVVIPFPQEFDIAKANYVLLTCRLEGQTRRQHDGKWSEWSRYNGAKIWWGAFLADADGRRTIDGAGFDAVSPDGYLPTETKTVLLPAKFFSRNLEGFADPARAKGFMITVPSTRDTNERDYTLTIDKLILAE